MSKKIPIPIVIFALKLLVASNLCAKQEMLIDLKDHWLIYEESGYQPYLHDKDNQIKSVSFVIPHPATEDSTFLYIRSKDGGAVFINNTLLYDTKALLDRQWYLSNFTEDNPVFVTVYLRSDLQTAQLTTQILVHQTSTTTSESWLTIIQHKNLLKNSDLLMIVLLLFASYIAFTRKFIWYDIISTFGFTSGSYSNDDNSYGFKFFTANNILALLIIPFLFIVVITYSLQTSLSVIFENIVAKFSTFRLLILIFFGVFMYIIIKYIWIRSISSLFSLQQFNSTQFYVWIKLLVISLFLSLLFAVALDNFFNLEITKYQVFNLLIILIIPKVILISVRANMLSGFKKLHLFSYLCATEVIPQFLLYHFITVQL